VTLHHLGWCDSCRAAVAALGMGAATAAGAGRCYRRHAAWLALAAFAVVAVPLVAGELVDPGTRVGSRGGGATRTLPLPASTTSATAAPAGEPETPSAVAPVARSKPAAPGGTASARAHKSLPLTT
jgi:hypothetical protein